MFKPLEGITVIDLTSVLAGPYSSYQLALLGANVIKIENLESGDWTRVGGKNKNLIEKSMGTSFLIQNSEKKSLQINLKTEEGKKIAHKLIKNSDVFIENMTPGKAEKIGLGWNEISKINNSIVYCSISAFGQDGPFKNRGAYDHVVQAMCGIMTTTGTLEHGPTKVGAAYVDYATGLNAAFGITAALHQVKQKKEAVRLDVAMLDTSLLLMANMVTEYLNSGWIPKQMGNEAQSGSPASGMFKTKSAPILIAANNNQQFSSLSNALDTIEKFDKNKWKSEKYRRDNQTELREEFQKRFITKTAEELELLLNKFSVPAGKVRTIPETVSEEQFSIRKLWEKIKIPSLKKHFKLPSLGFKVNGNTVPPKNPPPELGSDTENILRDIGYTEEDMKNLKEKNLIK